MPHRWTGSCLALLALLLACKGPEGSRREDAGGAATHARGCRTNAECAPDELCAFTPAICGKGTKAGACRSRSTPPADTSAPVCGCDGRTYDDARAAWGAGVDLSTTGGCRTPIADRIACGAHYCDVHTSYCAIYLSDVPDLPTDYFCRPLPEACRVDGGAATCDCFPRDTACRAFCGPLPTASPIVSGFHLTCQGRRPPPG